MRTGARIAAATLAVMGTHPHAASATEGGLGRSIPGSLIQNKAGVVAPIELTAINIVPLYFDGAIGGRVTVPEAGLVTAGLRGQAVFTPITLLKVWEANAQWSFASALTQPLLHVRATATVDSVAGSLRLRQSKFGLYDLGVTPLIVGHRFSKTEHASFKFTVWAPTGAYATGRLTNLSANYWTFIPTAAFTKLSADQTAEFNAQLGLQTHTRNKATDYQSAPVLTFDTLASKRFPSGVGVGGVLIVIQQVADDKGPLADRLGGFRGRDVALGPLLTYSTKVGPAPLDLSLRWLASVDSRNRLAGDTVMLTASMPIAVKLPTPAP
jgi:hypothetical protein